MQKWREQGCFVRFIDGDTLNCAIANLEYVSLKEAMQHIDDWKVDWDMNLSASEIELVKTQQWRDGLTFK